ncbi:MAG TPA: DUF5666 domain-containing protein [Aggregatilinea sp.]|uniref:DUF5666 domain-containing protein n=1 Tax=Aggregatilinea sp. TaxID=2806333 RepID=UPI002B507A53|nr:DUF5666 domain-containing protein [Aggregatilinea sp.]HML21503.1 DUF5666 domain-containing protein [Aggregatilinea sp.]
MTRGNVFRLLLVAVLAAAALAWAGPHARAQSDDTNKVELVGLIEAVEQDTITVNGLVVDVAGAQVGAALEVGTAVWIEGVTLADGTIRASEVIPAESGVLLPGELELVGLLDSLSASSAEVNGLAFDLAVAEVERGLAVGDLVKVHAGLSMDGNWIAREIETFALDDSTTTGATATAQPRFDDGEFEIVGTLMNAGEGFIVVAGQQIDVTRAEMHGTPLLGALVKVHLSLVNGEWVAREVETRFDAHRGRDGLDDDGGMDDANDDHSGSGSSGSGSTMDDNSSSGQGSDDAPGDDHGGDDNGGGDDSGDDDHSGGDDRGGDDNGGHGGDDNGGDD